MKKYPPPVAIVMSIVVIGAIIYGATNFTKNKGVTASANGGIANIDSSPTTINSETATSLATGNENSQVNEVGTLKSEVKKLKARIADCQNEIYEANGTIYNMNYAVIQIQIAQQTAQLPDLSILKTGNQVKDIVGQSLCFQDNEAVQNQDAVTNKAQQQASQTP